MKPNFDEHRKTFLQDSTDVVSRLARYYMLDSVRAEMHNEGYSLEGNTEESDLTWFARWLYEHIEIGRAPRFEDADSVAREHYLKLAKTCLEGIPQLMSRMSSRCIRISQAVNTIIKAEKLHEEYERIKELPGKPA